MKQMNRPREKEPDATTPEGQFALYLRHLMEKRKLNPDELAKRSFFSRATIYHWLSGERSPSVDKFPALADALGVTDWRKLMPPDSFLKSLEN